MATAAAVISFPERREALRFVSQTGDKSLSLVTADFCKIVLDSPPKPTHCFAVVFENYPNNRGARLFYEPQMSVATLKERLLELSKEDGVNFEIINHTAVVQHVKSLQELVGRLRGRSHARTSNTIRTPSS